MGLLRRRSRFQRRVDGAKHVTRFQLSTHAAFSRITASSSELTRTVADSVSRRVSLMRNMRRSRVRSQESFVMPHPFATERKPAGLQRRSFCPCLRAPRFSAVNGGTCLLLIADDFGTPFVRASCAVSFQTSCGVSDGSGICSGSLYAKKFRMFERRKDGYFEALRGEIRVHNVSLTGDIFILRVMPDVCAICAQLLG